VSLSTFYVFDKENAAKPQLGEILAQRGCGAAHQRSTMNLDQARQRAEQSFKHESARVGRKTLTEAQARTIRETTARLKALGLCPCVRLRSSRVRLSVMGWSPIGFPIALDGGDLCLEIILGRRAPKWGARHIDSIVLTF
jgi:hypothetical protein